jgi:hypothetical protein
VSGEEVGDPATGEVAGVSCQIGGGMGDDGVVLLEWEQLQASVPSVPGESTKSHAGSAVFEHDQFGWDGSPPEHGLKLPGESLRYSFGGSDNGHISHQPTGNASRLSG